ncbi:hypothetical protein [Streptomyces sp. B93]|uniref:hypothetical protein n=1 Tax=Streptomyces sp. B93 TaxID=2824875 RepID=UPI001B38A2B4|nr:hypothetical protein [Streptomyces sp. B93]MBQ1091386.1 hypothetical protein [Streptomyces sp. B93]
MQGGDDKVNVFRNEDFAYQRITVERPLKAATGRGSLQRSAESMHEDQLSATYRPEEVKATVVPTLTQMIACHAQACT